VTADSFPVWPYAFGGPSGQGQIKSCADDFIVTESLAFTPEGNGEHCFVEIEKSGENTEYLARRLARFAGVRQRDIGYAGLKDRHGRTRQWFSIWMPGKDDPDWHLLESDSIKVIQSCRHLRKLKRGALIGNDFQITLRACSLDKQVVASQLQAIKQRGFPNYFGEQRFGNRGQNLQRAYSLFQGAKFKPELRSLYLSAARSYLFNLILAERVKNECWDQALPDEVFKLAGSNSWFSSPILDDALTERLHSGDIHPSGPLWGKGSGVAPELEAKIIETQTQLAEGLVAAGLEYDRRALRCQPENLCWEFASDSLLNLSFCLPAGSYATVLLREIAVCQQKE
jgi:tRNA pseudouridine13 synthase